MPSGDRLWQALLAELDAWQQRGQPATLWWRDDDAEQDSPALQRLNRLSIRFGIPLTLAVIPVDAKASLAPLFAANTRLQAWQHGYSHRNHAPPAQRKCELGDHRPLATVLEELQRGRVLLQGLLGERFAPVLVPPWNRLAAGLIPRLDGAGFCGLSTLGPRQPLALPTLNVHVDLINWRDGGRFAGEAAVLTQLLGHLQARRLGRVDASEPSGIMTHHLAHDEACWAFLERFFGALVHHPGLRWVNPLSAL